jgi:SAM-dependent methyltransferase
MVHIIQRFVKFGRLLDIGPGHGLFAYRAKKSGFEVEAIEMDRRCAEYLNSTLGIPTLWSNQPEQALEHLGPYDVITLLHTLEHLPAPIATLRAVARALNVNGILIVAMPSVDSLQFKMLGKFWAHLDAPRHFQLIPRDRLTELTERMGFKEITVTSSDAMGLYANSFGWRRSFANLSQTEIGKRLLGNIGKVLEVAFQRFEGIGLRGSTFTVVYRKLSPEDQVHS